ncbi:tetratricopeptide (TPR) repeat protein [Agrobacterium tumefaciens]|nr:tetratricopeptide (TPR) repeat protein [Agrobacterium radiobacter]MBP2540187.1 tetratricopeptide (TPR) repeat protein [Agrobacterium tumefaciens]MCP2136934.1 tetratricopeptide (TPR) repeat protein [Rhizobium sp. SLBN-94]MBB4324118.1 tetratricopeptide (TPR) repeat protein [Agrobacterium radiobacter]MBB4336244.1 tetratricopeptide (TPR) repeat protein [Agrobacterium radiobacter]
MAAIAHAADGLAPAVAESAPSPAKTIDTLFASLKKERNAVKARSIANQIASEWNDSGSATINLLMQWAGEAADEKRNAAAYDFLDQVVLLDPDYVQAPYRRAMVHFADGDTRKAMADINLTLAREPRYFPALASLANILEASGRDELALKAWERYLALYPADKDARKEAADLSEKLAGTRG